MIQLAHGDTKDTLVLLHWKSCGWCKDLMPKFNSASRRVRPGVWTQKFEHDALDAVDQPGAYPKMLFYKAGVKRPVKVPDTVRSEAAIVAYVKKHRTT
jgi:hypothetical protein